MRATFYPPTHWQAETCHEPARAHSYCARSASKKGTWPLPPLLAVFFSILIPSRDRPLARDTKLQQFDRASKRPVS